jgi:fructose-1,6-bisphosphatase/inositol monophosphatase family enzyme
MTATAQDTTVPPVTDRSPFRTLAVFGAAADAVAATLAALTDRGPSGRREGQYALDLDADAACLGVLHEAGFRVLSEESGFTGASDGPVVVVDPVDGSTNASRGVPWFATALCLVDENGPAVAMVANHATGERFTALRGEGAERDGVRIRPSGCTELSQAILGVSGLPTRHYGWAQFRAMGASAPDLCAVACGVTDAWCDMSTDAHGVWDYLASVLICTEAGASVAEVHGRDLAVLDHAARRTPVAAATPELLAAVLRARLGR